MQNLMKFRNLKFPEGPRRMRKENVKKLESLNDIISPNYRGGFNRFNLNFVIINYNFLYQIPILVKNNVLYTSNNYFLL
jgi:hypothetical protein